MAVKFIAIGTSLGGLSALTQLFSDLPEDFAIPIAVAMHRAPMEFDYLISTLQKSTSLNIQEASDKLPIAATNITIAPADYHLLVDHGHYALSVDAPVQYARPSIDVLFESVAHEFKSAAMGIILTGGNRDGVHGLKAIKRLHGSVLIESPETAEDEALPQAAMDSGVAEIAYPINQIASELLLRCKRDNI